MEARTHTFGTLDALRGVAALAVVCYHCQRFLVDGLFDRGYLAVDFFFLLSGFVLTYAYQQRLDAGWTLASFLRTRWFRLYPLYFAGLALEIVFTVFRDHFGRVHLSGSTLLALFALALLFLPVPPQFTQAGILSFPLNGPCWSLFFELLGNVFHAGVLRRKSRGFLLTIVLLSGLLLAAAVWKTGTLDVGSYRSTTLYAVPRILFSYTLGALLFRGWKTWKPWTNLSPTWLALLLLLVLLLPQVPWMNTVLDFLLVALGFPLLLLLGASSQLRPRLMATGQFLGESSYAVYVLHVPFLGYFEQAWVKVAKHPMELDRPWSGILYMVAVTIFAVAAVRLYDMPFRAFLNRSLARSKAARACHL